MLILYVIYIVIMSLNEPLHQFVISRINVERWGLVSKPNPETDALNKSDQGVFYSTFAGNGHLPANDRERVIYANDQTFACPPNCPS